MHPVRRTIVLALLLLSPILAAAEEVTTFDFRNGQIPGDWSGGGAIQVRQTTSGLELSASGDGGITRKVTLDHPVDVVRFTVIAPQGGKAMFVWQAANTGNNYFKKEFDIPAQDGEQTIDLNFGVIPGWNRNPQIIGLALPTGGQLTLADIGLRGWTGTERLTEAWKSFWTFDQFTAYTINFFWGPLIVFDPVSRARLFEEQPPNGYSANRAFYAILIVAGIGLSLLARFRPRGNWKASYLRERRPYLYTFVCLFAVLWIFYDIRMGAEYLSYSLHDWKTWISQPVGERTFRQYQNFHDIAEQAGPYLMEDGTYAALVPDKTAVLSMLRYLTYPSTPLGTGADATGIRTWFVFWRSDASVNERGELVVGGQTATPPGKIIKRFDDKSFLFRVDS